MRYFCKDYEIGNSSLTHSLFVLRTNLVIGKTPHYPLSLPTLLRVEGGDSRHSLSQSQHKQKVETLSEQMQLWQTAFASSPIANLAVNLNERVIMVNKQAYSLLGLTYRDPI
jgi:PAS domain-containing protein